MFLQQLCRRSAVAEDNVVPLLFEHMCVFDWIYSVSAAAAQSDPIRIQFYIF